MKPTSDHSLTKPRVNRGGGTTALQVSGRTFVDGIKTNQPVRTYARPVRDVAAFQTASDNVEIRKPGHGYYAKSKQPGNEQRVETKPMTLELPNESPLHNKYKPTEKIESKYLLVCHVAIFAGIIILVSVLNHQFIVWLLAAYALAIIVKGIQSRYVFGAAIFTLTAVPILLITNKDLMAENYAAYSFYLLAIGCFAAILELRKYGDTAAVDGFGWNRD